MVGHSEDASGAVFSFSGEVSILQEQGVSASLRGRLVAVEGRADRWVDRFSSGLRPAAFSTPVLPDNVLSTVDIICCMTGNQGGFIRTCAINVPVTAFVIFTSSSASLVQ